jgi:hypothetical protein
MGRNGRRPRVRRKPTSPDEKRHRGAREHQEPCGSRASKSGSPRGVWVRPPPSALTESGVERGLPASGRWQRGRRQEARRVCLVPRWCKKSLYGTRMGSANCTCTARSAPRGSSGPGRRNARRRVKLSATRRQRCRLWSNPREWGSRSRRVRRVPGPDGWHWCRDRPVLRPTG